MARLRGIAKRLAGVARSNVWFLRGAEANTGKPLRILFAGGDTQKDFIAQLIFDGACQETLAGKFYFWKILYLLRRNSHHFSLAFIEGRRLHQFLYQGSNDYFIPFLVESCVDLPLKATNKSAKEDLRRIRKHELTFELTKDVEVLRDFYHNMYLVTIHDRHGKFSVSSSFEEVARVVSTGDNQLLLVRHEETAIAGVVIKMGDVPELWLAGIRSSSNTYRRMGAVGATYYFPALYLAEQGYRQMTLGRSRSFFNDGVLQYKSKWNHRLCGFDTNGMVFKVLENSDALTGFLTSQPFARVERRELHATVFVDSLSESNEGTLKEIEALRSLQGLAGVTVVAVGGRSGEWRNLSKWPAANLSPGLVALQDAAK